MEEISGGGHQHLSLMCIFGAGFDSSRSSWEGTELENEDRPHFYQYLSRSGA